MRKVDRWQAGRQSCVAGGKFQTQVFFPFSFLNTHLLSFQPVTKFSKKLSIMGDLSKHTGANTVISLLGFFLDRLWSGSMSVSVWVRNAAVLIAWPIIAIAVFWQSPWAGFYLFLLWLMVIVGLVLFSWVGMIALAVSCFGINSLRTFTHGDFYDEIAGNEKLLHYLIGIVVLVYMFFMKGIVAYSASKDYDLTAKTGANSTLVGYAKNVGARVFRRAGKPVPAFLAENDQEDRM
jgi:hypothetical protein